MARKVAPVVIMFYVTRYMFKVSVLYEDKDVLVLNKPAGLAAHSDGRTDEPTLADWIIENYPAMKNVGEPLKLKTENSRPTEQSFGRVKLKTISRPGIVHRLDKETSGAMVIAKNPPTFIFLKKQFQDREVEKTYRAFVYGELKQNEGVIDRPIARSRKDFRMWSAQRGARGKEREAVTEYSVLSRIPATVREKGDGTGFSFINVRPKTGRTHQIRVHLKAINHPIVCDKLYAPKRECALGFKRTALHAFSVAFSLPSGKHLKVEAPYPADFQTALLIFENRKTDD